MNDNHKQNNAKRRMGRINFRRKRQNWQHGKRSTLSYSHAPSVHGACDYVLYRHHINRFFNSQTAHTINLRDVECYSALYVWQRGRWKTLNADESGYEEIPQRRAFIVWSAFEHGVGWTRTAKVTKGVLLGRNGRRLHHYPTTGSWYYTG